MKKHKKRNTDVHEKYSIISSKNKENRDKWTLHAEEKGISKAAIYF